MAKKLCTSLFLYFVVLAGISCPADASQCPPYPGSYYNAISQRAAGSDLIFVGLVEEVEELETTGYRVKRTSYVATIKVLELIKGTINEPSQRVYFSSGWYSAGFATGWQYLVFASKFGADGSLDASRCTVKRLGTEDDFASEQTREPTANQQDYLRILREIHSSPSSGEH